MEVTVYDSFKTVSGYPIPDAQIRFVATKRGIGLDNMVTPDIAKSDSYRLAQADLMKWVSTAPNISQGGVSFDILYSDRERLREMAEAIYGELGETATGDTKPKYGYKGSRL